MEISLYGSKTPHLFLGSDINTRIISISIGEEKGAALVDNNNDGNELLLAAIKAKSVDRTSEQTTINEVVEVITGCSVEGPFR